MIRPLGDRVLVKPDAQPTSQGGVIIPEFIKEKPHTGIVLAVGIGNVNTDGTRTEPDVQPGDHVLFSQYVGVDAAIGGAAYLVLREGDILGVLDDEAVAQAEAERGAVASA